MFINKNSSKILNYINLPDFNVNNSLFDLDNIESFIDLLIQGELPVPNIVVDKKYNIIKANQSFLFLNYLFSFDSFIALDLIDSKIKVNYVDDIDNIKNFERFYDLKSSKYCLNNVSVWENDGLTNENISFISDLLTFIYSVECVLTVQKW